MKQRKIRLSASFPLGIDSILQAGWGGCSELCTALSVRYLMVVKLQYAHATLKGWLYKARFSKFNNK